METADRAGASILSTILIKAKTNCKIKVKYERRTVLSISKTQQKELAKLFEQLSLETMQLYIKKYQSDFSVNKLYSVIFCRLFTFCWFLDKSELSLRSIAQSSESQIFKELAEIDEAFSVGKTALSERLSHIPYELFRDIFEDLSRNSLNKLPVKEKYSDNVAKLLSSSYILDSTIITLSAKLLKTGYLINEGQLSLKATMAMSGRQIPVKALLFTDKEYSSEDIALPKLFDFNKKETIYIFDRGIQKLQTYADISKNGSYFISRLMARNYNIVSSKIFEKIETATLTIISDEVITFPKLKNNKLEFHLITAVSKKDNEMLKFITNLKDINPVDITEAYRCRWSIEIFFRFLKSQLHLKKLLSYSENGIKVNLYLVLIAFLITWIFKEQNKIKSFKRAREQLKWLLLELLANQQFNKGFVLGTSLNPIISSA